MEWVSLRQAGDVLGLKSVKQVRRRLKSEGWRTRLSQLGRQIVREVHSEDVNSSRERKILDEPEWIKDLEHVPAGTSLGVPKVSRVNVPADVQAMSQAIKDLLGSVDSIKTDFAKMIDGQERLISIEKGRAGVEKIRAFITPVIFACFVGLLAWGGYYSYNRLTSYYKERFNDLRGYYQEQLSLKEKETNALAWAYGQALSKHEKKVEDLKGRIEVLEARVSTERGEE